MSAPYSRARSGTPARSGSSYWPRSAVYAQGTAPFSRIQATATEVSRPPENAIPTFCPWGSDSRTLDTRWEPICAGRAATVAAQSVAVESATLGSGVPGGVTGQCLADLGPGEAVPGHHQDGV